MPDSNIGALPQVQTLDDSSLMVVEQQGQAMKMNGAQFKEFGKQGVKLEFLDYLEDAQDAAQEAKDAARAVTDMTVAAQTLESGQAATVRKSMQNGVNHLDFGLPRGAQGVPGPEGKTGPRGPRGEPGAGLKIGGYYDSLEDLEAAQPSPQPGEAYGVGTQPPFDIYVFDGENGTWVNNGPLGVASSLIPEDVVTAEGGASMAFTGLGEAPYDIQITDEEEPPLTAEDILYGEGTVQEAMEGLFTSVSDGKALVASAITDKGVPTQPDAAFSQLAENIGAITTGASTGDATATPGDILAPKTAYTAAGKVEGIIPTLPPGTIVPGTADQTIAGGQYLGGTQIIKGDGNLTSANIKKGVSIFGVEGAVEQTFLATLTVTVDIGAVVTAKNGDTDVTALCTTGAVTLELPLEGRWIVTAQRGVAQYNSVTVDVSSSYTASLTAEVHIVYHGSVSGMGSVLDSAAVTLGSSALFGYGYISTTSRSNRVYKYDESLTKSYQDNVGEAKSNASAAAVGNRALFAGGAKLNASTKVCTRSVYAVDDTLNYITLDDLTVAKCQWAGVTIGEHALFGGGTVNPEGAGSGSSGVEAYDSSFTRKDAAVLASPEKKPVAAANANYAIICGASATAYNSSLTRSMPPAPEESAIAAARAGNYVVVAGANEVTAYDLFLTRSLAEPLSIARTTALAGTTLGDFAIFAGGDGSEENATAEVYDIFLTRTTVKSTYDHTGQMKAATAGNFALFSREQFGTVQAYQYQ